MDKFGTCPKCGGENLNYETCINDGKRFYYPYVCDDCDTAGKEWYGITFLKHTCD